MFPALRRNELGPERYCCACEGNSLAMRMVRGFLWIAAFVLTFA